MNRSSFLTTRPSIFDIDARLPRFWELENVSPSSAPVSDAEQCERHFLETTTQAENGQFIVRLPFKASPSSLQPNYASVKGLFLRAESRRKADIRGQYSEFLSEYEKLGHMSKVGSTNLGYFIPRHAVLRLSSSTTKLRVVFASFKTSSSLPRMMCLWLDRNYNQIYSMR